MDLLTVMFMPIFVFMLLMIWAALYGPGAPASNRRKEQEGSASVISLTDHLARHGRHGPAPRPQAK